MEYVLGTTNSNDTCGNDINYADTKNRVFILRHPSSFSNVFITLHNNEAANPSSCLGRVHDSNLFIISMSACR